MNEYISYGSELEGFTILKEEKEMPLWGEFYPSKKPKPKMGIGLLGDKNIVASIKMKKVEVPMYDKVIKPAFIPIRSRVYPQI